MKDFIFNNWHIIATGAVLGYAALVTSLPQERKDFNWYDYFYNVTHALLPVRTRIEKPHA